MAKWLAREFDWTTGKYTGNYYDIAQAGVVSVFVDSYTGSDTNAGTAAAPFKTLSKAITTLNSTGANGSRIFMNGVFSENLPSQTYWYEFIGCGGGYGGRTVLYSNNALNTRVYISKYYCRLSNIITLDYNKLYLLPIAGFPVYINNCFFRDISIGAGGNIFQYYIYNTVFYMCHLTRCGSAYGQQGGNNVTVMECTYDTVVPTWYSVLQNSHYYNNSWSYSGYTMAPGSIWGVDGQYIDPENSNFNLQPTSPLLFAGTTDPQTGIKSHVGAGVQGFQNTPASLAFTVAGGATLTNLEVFESKLRRVDNNQPAKLTSGYVYLGGAFPITKIDVHNVFDFDSLGVTKGVFASLTGSPRPALTIKIKYGNTTAEVDSCPWLEIEYGKKPTFSGTGVNRKGNGDDTFDNTAESNINASILRVEAELKNR